MTAPRSAAHPAAAADATTSRRIWLNGRLVAPEQATVSVFDHGLLYGDGVFEGIRVYAGRIFKLRTHLRRLFDSARAIRLEMPYSIDEVEQAVRETVQANGRQEGYVRLCVTRGAGTLGLNPFNCASPNVFVICDAITLYPQQMYTDGMAVVTAATVRNHPAALSPRIKSLNYLNNILAKIEALDAGVMEAVMLNHQGHVAECTGDNLFVVREWERQTALITPPLHAGVLEGVTMNVIIELARQAGLAVHRMDLSRHDLYIADEVFLTGTAAEAIPVTKIDGRVIGSPKHVGRPGPVTTQLIQAFRRLVAEDAPED